MTTFPIIYVSNVKRPARFYEEAFGFERSFVWDEPDGVFIALKRQSSDLGIGEGEGRGGFELCIYVDDVDATAARLRSLGAHEVSPPEDKPWNERMAYFEDPDGHRLHVTMSV